MFVVGYDVTCKRPIERFHPRDQQAYWITETKESILHKNRDQFPDD